MRATSALPIVALLALAAARSITYDSRSYVLDGKRALLLSGSIHYQRVEPSDWPRVLSLAAEANFNVIQTYVTWDEHEATEGTISWSGRNNITAFVSLAQSRGLNVVVRIGPYICGEHFNGGIPLWMRAVEGSGASCFRCTDPVWENFSTHVLGEVVGQLRASNLLYTQGGPVIMLQVENEYNGDIIYLKDVVAAARNITTDVPWILCHDEDLCSAVNADGGGALGKAVCTINGFWEDDSAEGDSQPSPTFVKKQRENNPNQPLSWTEDQGWFDQWGVGQRVRRPSDILYGVARAFSLGFTHHNFYMLTGGSNFAYSAADAVTTAYAPDTAIDFLLLRHEPKFSTVANFQKALLSVADELLSTDAPTPVPIGAFVETATFGGVVFISNKGTLANESQIVSVAGGSWLVPNHTVVILNHGALLFNTSAAPDFAPASTAQPLSAASAPTWVTISESLGFGNNTATAPQGSPPLEMLNLTHSTVDYMYFSLTPASPVNASTLKVNTCGGEYVYVFASSGASTSAARLVSRRPSEHLFALDGGAATIHILVSAMGLSTGPSPKSCKGVVRVVAGSTDLSTEGWTSRWVFHGEVEKIFTPAGAAAAAWTPVASDGGTIPTSWFKTTFDLPPPPAGALNVLPGAPPQLAYALDLTGATKGVAWVNGFNLGRYNLELGVCNGDCAPPHHGTACYIYWRNCGLPTQRFYHIPTALLQPTGNLIVLFEETATVPVAGQGPAAPSPPPPRPGAAARVEPAALGTARNLGTVALVALDAHP